MIKRGAVIALATIAALAMLILGGCAGKHVPDGVVKDALITHANSQTFAENDYIKDASYSVEEFQLIKTEGGPSGSQVASFNAMLSNGKIRSSITGRLTFEENGGNWRLAGQDGGLEIDSLENRALTGVDFGDEASDSKAVFDELAQTCVLTDDISESNWLIDKTGEITETFTFRENKWVLDASKSNIAVKPNIASDMQFDLIGSWTAQPRGSRYSSDPNGYFYPLITITEFDISSDEDLTGTMQVRFTWEPKNHYATVTESCTYSGTFKLTTDEPDSLGEFEISDPDWSEDLWAYGTGMPPTFTGEFSASKNTLLISYLNPSGTESDGPYKYQG